MWNSWNCTSTNNDVLIKSSAKNKAEHKAAINSLRKEIDTVNPNNSTVPPVVQEGYFYKLHELYYNGVPDKYGLDGNKIKGVEPDAKKSLFYLRKAIACRNDPKLWFVMGSIFQNGMYNMDPDLDAASQIYSYIYNRYAGTEEAGTAWDEYQNTMHEMQTRKTYGLLNLKYTPKKNEHHEKIKKLFNKTAAGNPLTFTAPHTTRVNGGNFFRAAPGNAGADEGAVVLAIDDHRRNDMHNTHNSQVVSTVANSVNKLKEITSMNIPLAQTVQDIRNLIMGKASCDRRDDALKSLESIERNILPISSVNMKETDVLNIIWNRINSQEHENSKNDIKDIFYNQLSDMQEHGKSVCPTGRLERLVDTLNTFDKAVAIKPTYIINQEMMNKAEAIRDQLYNKVKDEKGESMVTQYQNGTAADQDQFDQQLKDKIVNELDTDYVKTGIVTENKFKTLTEKWIDEI